MTKREYKVVHFTDVKYTMNKLWEEWWELVVWLHYEWPSVVWTYLIFKRPLLDNIKIWNY